VRKYKGINENTMFLLINSILSIQEKTFEKEINIAN
jgi:hypothetical protein